MGKFVQLYYKAFCLLKIINQRTEGMEFVVCNSFSSFDYFLVLEMCISNMIQLSTCL